MAGAGGGGDLGRVGGSQGRAQLREAGAEAWPEQLVIWQHLVLDQPAFLSDELECFDVQLVLDDLDQLGAQGRLPGGLPGVDQHLAERLAHLEVGAGSGR